MYVDDSPIHTTIIVMFETFKVTVVHVNLTIYVSCLASFTVKSILKDGVCERLQYLLTSFQRKVHHNDKVQCTGVLPLHICIDVCNLSCNHIAEVLYKPL